MWWTWWDAKAFNLKQSVMQAEAIGFDEVTSHQARVAAIFARQDLVQVYSLLSSLNQQIATVKLLLLAILTALAVIAYRM